MADRGDTPTGMQPANDALYLVFQAGHPHVDECNDPVRYGSTRVNPSTDGELAFKDWQDTRAQSHIDNGTPIPPEVVPGQQPVEGVIT